MSEEDKIQLANSWGSFESMAIDAARNNLKVDAINAERTMWGLSPLVESQQAIGIHKYIIQYCNANSTTTKVVK